MRRAPEDVHTVPPPPVPAAVPNLWRSGHPGRVTRPVVHAQKRAAIEAALAQEHGVVAHAAARLGVSERTLWNNIRRLAIPRLPTRRKRG